MGGKLAFVDYLNLNELPANFSGVASLLEKSQSAEPVKRGEREVDKRKLQAFIEESTHTLPDRRSCRRVGKFHAIFFNSEG
jgi:hypothetical protein